MAATLGGEGGPRAGERTGNVLQTTDPPEHDALRRIVNRGFTPRAPGDDVLSKLIHAARDDDGVLQPEHVHEFATSLLVAGYETTANLISSCVLALVREPGVARAVAADRGLVPTFVEETLRHDGPAQLLMRRTTAERVLAGVTIPAGAMVIPILGSANRDERRFHDPDRFDLERPERGHLAFGQGVHFCLGAAIARAEAQEAVEGLLGVLDGLEWLGDPYENVPALMMRGPRRLRFRRR